MNFQYLLDLGYSEKEVADFSTGWNQGILEYLSENSGNVSENMKFLMPYFSKSFLLRLTVWYSNTFSIPSKYFKARITAMQTAFPDEWADIIEKQYWSYSGIPGSNYDPFLSAAASYDDNDYKKAIEMLQNPSAVIFEFMVLLSRECNITVSSDDFFESCLWYLEESKYEVLRNVQKLQNDGLSDDTVTTILTNAPYLMCLSDMEVRERLIKGFGENYIEQINAMEYEEDLYRILEEIGW